MKGISEKDQVKVFETAFEASYDGLHILDAEGHTLYINKACSRIEGITEKEIMTKNIRQLVEEGVYSESVTLKVLETKQATTIIQTTKNGNQLLVTGTPIFNENGDIDKIVVNSRDVTALNMLKKELLEKDELTKKYQKELELLRKETHASGDIVSKSIIMQKILRLALNVAFVDSTVLITGESGVGKGLLAKFIHDNSGRKDGPFIKIDCSAIPESLFESELFGYEAGAFTGADKRGKIGLMELADGGTVFLDEIGEIPISMQAKLMRAIQDKEIAVVGGKFSKSLDIRIIAATNLDLTQRVRDRTFREDLFYRLNVVPIHIPPLRERRDDIHPLILSVVSKINDNYEWVKILSNEALNTLFEYHWPGNVRELENLVERVMVSVSKDIIGKEDLPELQIGEDNDRIIAVGDYQEALARHDYMLIKNVISREGSIPKAAKVLGVDVTTVRRKLRKFEKLTL